MADAAISYEEVPYQSVALIETHPDRLATVGTLFGLDVAPVPGSRILELGCAGGENLIAMAHLLPDSVCVGVDSSPRQIDQARALAESSGARNVTLHAISLADITPALGEFDYIVCHGVYSWVPAPIREAIFRVMREALAPRGVGYVSYNTYPGWHVPGMVREMMLYHIRKIDGAAAKIKAARAFLDHLSQSIPEKDGPYAKILAEESLQLRPHADSYIAHEHLEEVNTPVYFHEFAESAAAHRLKVFSDSRVWSTAVAVQPTTAGILNQFTRDATEREQYFDFLCNRRFRRSLLCRAEAETLKVPTIDRLKSLRASAGVWPATTPVDLASKSSLDFLAADGTVRLSCIDPIFKAALVILSEAHPRSLPFAEAWAQTRRRLGRSGVEAGHDPDVLARLLLQAFAANALELHAFEPAFPESASERPEAFVMARIAAASGTSVPNLRHHHIPISEFDRLVVRLLDGSRTIPEVVDGLMTSALDGSFPILQDSVPLRDAETIRPILERSVPPSLRRLMRLAILVK